MSDLPLGLTFDDVLVIPGYADFMPDEVDLACRLTRRVTLNTPIVSAAMDTVTEHAMAIAMARIGGIGFIHRNMSTERQVEEILLVKAAEAGTPRASVDGQGRLLVGAALGPGGAVERAEALLAAGADVLALDTAHGHSRNVIEAVRAIKQAFPDAQVVAGNIATAAAAEALIVAGADGLKAGVGPGSICTTRVVAGAGVPQITAIQWVSGVAKAHGVPVIADGGIQFSGDLVKAIAAGADSVMLGSLLARCKESPGQEILLGGRVYKEYRGMGSIGALSNEGNDRYAKSTNSGPVVPEGIEGRIPLSGTVDDVLVQLIGGLRKGMGYAGLRTIGEMQSQAQLVRITGAGVRESHPHDITITKEAPNYSRVV
ncbi:MAG: inosine-5-monophosphate dehydrogenase [Cyanobacteria bacterium RYN_339]|nr:inosine-5-monophosphate dehydrogenase [Cyanobacteria bacterium RYN_339]